MGTANPVFGRSTKEARDTSREHLAEQPLPLTVLNFHGDGEAPAKLRNPMVEQGHARFETHTHARSIQLHQNIVRQVSDGVPKHHLLKLREPGRYS